MNKRRMTRVRTRKLDRAVAKHRLGDSLHRAIKYGQFPKIWRDVAEEEKRRR